MTRIKLAGLLGAAILPGILSAGTIQLGTSTSTLSFNPPDLSAGSCTMSNVCTISGGGTLQGVPNQYSIVTTLSGGNPIQWTGSGPTYGINQEGAAIAFNFSDSPGMDTLAGTVVLNSMVTSTSPTDATDIFATITFTSVHLVTPALELYLTTNYGALPTMGGTALLDLTVSCNVISPPSQVSCIPPVTMDPNSTSVSASIAPGTLSTAPEPGSMVRLGCGLAAIAFKLKRRA
jgi:hypothetical protein